MQKEGTVTGLFRCFLVVELVLVFFFMYREGQNREQMVCYHIQAYAAYKEERKEQGFL